jgi:hypothetical protein
LKTNPYPAQYGVINFCRDPDNVLIFLLGAVPRTVPGCTRGIIVDLGGFSIIGYGMRKQAVKESSGAGPGNEKATTAVEDCSL